MKNHVLSAKLSRHFLVFALALFAGACGGGTDSGAPAAPRRPAGHGGSSTGTGGGAGTGAAGTTGRGGGGTTGSAGTRHAGGAQRRGTGRPAGRHHRDRRAPAAGGATGGGGAHGGSRRQRAAAAAAGSGGRGGNGGHGGQAATPARAAAAAPRAAAGRRRHDRRRRLGRRRNVGGRRRVVVQDGATMTGGAFVRTAWTATYTCTGTCPAQGAADTADADTKRAFDGNRGTRWSTGQYQQIERADEQVPALLHRRHESRS